MQKFLYTIFILEYFMDSRTFDNLKIFYDCAVEDPQINKILKYITGDDYSVSDVRENVVRV